MSTSRHTQQRTSWFLMKLFIDVGSLSLARCVHTKKNKHPIWTIDILYILVLGRIKNLTKQSHHETIEKKKCVAQFSIQSERVREKART